MLPARRSRGAFTLIEMMLSIAIISVLVSITITSISPQRQLDSAERSKLLTLINQLEARTRDWQIGRQLQIEDISDFWAPICRYKEDCGGLSFDGVQDAGYTDLIPYTSDSRSPFTGLQARSVGGQVQIRLASFDPRDINGLTMWLDAGDQSTLFTNHNCTQPVSESSTYIGCWKDKVNGSNAATQNSTTRKARWYFGNAAYFDGNAYHSVYNSGDYYTFEEPVSAATFAIVVDTNLNSYCHALLGRPRYSDGGWKYYYVFLNPATGSYGGYGVSFDGQDATLRGRYAINGGDFTPYAGNAGTKLPDDKMLLYGEFEQADARTSAWEWLGQLTYTSFPTNPVCNPRFYLHDMYLFNRILTPTERSSLEDYVMTKWDIGDE